MSSHQIVWDISSKPFSLNLEAISENELEQLIVDHPSIVTDEWLMVGRQAYTSAGGKIDLLAIDGNGTLILLELKRNRTPKDVVAQSLDYASWVESLRFKDVSEIFAKFSGGKSLTQTFAERFGQELGEDDIDGTHKIVIVASSLDAVTDRIIKYLSAHGITINVLFFQILKHEGKRLLSCAWLLPPTQIVDRSTSPAGQPPAKWNGEFYGSFGHDEFRKWSEARAFGVFSAGGGIWYTKTLNQLRPGHRIWVNVPGKGYVGVGCVLEEAQPAHAVIVDTPEGPRSWGSLVANNSLNATADSDSDDREMAVKVKWLATVPLEEAVRKAGLFGNQNSVCRPTKPKWNQTVEYLKTVFTNYDDVAKEE